ncbi:MAG: hypothetical protein AB7S78_01085 [Candidatus Omnitrophota bacterium]
MENSAKQWVEIALEKNKDELSAIRGQISQTVFEQILENTYTGYFFKLEKVHWICEEEEELTNKTYLKFYIYGHNLDLVGLEGSSFFRTQDIRQVSPLAANYDKSYENAKFQESLFNS